MGEHEQARTAARDILDPVFSEHGFRPEDGAAGHGSGGAFAMWSYEGDGRRTVFETKDRHPLLVSYVLDEPPCHSAHEYYMRALSDGAVKAPLDGTPLEQAATVREHLKRYGADFLSGDAEVLQRLEREPVESPSGFAAVTAAEERIRNEQAGGT